VGVRLARCSDLFAVGSEPCICDVAGVISNIILFPADHWAGPQMLLALGATAIGMADSGFVPKSILAGCLFARNSRAVLLAALFI